MEGRSGLFWGRNLRKVSFGFDFDVLYSPVFDRTTEWDMNILNRIQFQNTSEFSMRLRREYVYLFDDFDPTNTGGQELPADSEYTINRVLLNYESDFRKRFFFRQVVRKIRT